MNFAPFTIVLMFFALASCKTIPTNQKVQEVPSNALAEIRKFEIYSKSLFNGMEMSVSGDLDTGRFTYRSKLDQEVYETEIQLDLAQQEELAAMLSLVTRYEYAECTYCLADASLFDFKVQWQGESYEYFGKSGECSCKGQAVSNLPTIRTEPLNLILIFFAELDNAKYYSQN